MSNLLVETLLSDFLSESSDETPYEVEVVTDATEVGPDADRNSPTSEEEILDEAEEGYELELADGDEVITELEDEEESVDLVEALLADL